MIRLITLIVIPSFMVSAAILVLLGRGIIQITVVAGVTVASIAYCVKDLLKEPEFVECDGEILWIKLSDFSLEVPLAEIASIRENSRVMGWTYDEDIREPFKIIMRNGDVHEPPRRINLLRIVRQIDIDSKAL